MACVQAILLLMPAAAHAQAAKPVDIPDGLSAADKADLGSRKATLAEQRVALSESIKSHNGKCTKVAENSPLVGECRGSQAKIEAAMKAYQIAVVNFNNLVSQKVAGSGDTSVVDARVPRDGAWLTAQVPELAGSPAADRISKGFQAVVNHDWPVALAWWQEALQRDPGNAALKRSVELAQWMVDRRKAAAAGPAARPSAWPSRPPPVAITRRPSANSKS